jgi:hypothetical protein
MSEREAIDGLVKSVVEALSSISNLHLENERMILESVKSIGEKVLELERRISRLELLQLYKD